MLFVFIFSYFFCIKNMWRLHTTYPKREVPLQAPHISFLRAPNFPVSHSNEIQKTRLENSFNLYPNSTWCPRWVVSQSILKYVAFPKKKCTQNILQRKTVFSSFWASPIGLLYVAWDGTKGINKVLAPMGLRHICQLLTSPKLPLII